MDSAEKLVAERGSEAASSRAIILGAGQRHNSAITYHFGSRQRLFDAVWFRGSSVVNQQRREMIAQLEPIEWTLELLVDLYITPFANYLDARHPSYWARLNEDALRGYPLLVVPHLQKKLDAYPGEQPLDTLHGIFQRMQWLIGEAGDPDPTLRVSIAVRAAIATFAAWERESQSQETQRTATGLDRDLRASTLAILTSVHAPDRGPARL